MSAVEPCPVAASIAEGMWECWISVKAAVISFSPFLVAPKFAAASSKRKALTEALAVWISIDRVEDQVVAFLFLSLIFPRSQSRVDEEMDALIQAEALALRNNHYSTRAVTLDRLGEIHVAQGTYDEAEECYRLAQAIFSSMDDVRGEATELLTVGMLYVLQDRHHEAEECFVDARVAYARIVDVEGEAKALDRLMGVQALQGKFVDAKAACVEAREMYVQMGRPMSEMCEKIWELVAVLDSQIGSMSAGLFLSS
ncbi:hypothetical protein FRC04_000701 [Tulasnella sp. 424]|nr:hypothetical protein FRC04_000701 [Tulasnella sp. 424]KAG8967689.1 hypothetical protein FRC05_001947 [Tulasnella sp. 425]